MSGSLQTFLTYNYSRGYVQNVYFHSPVLTEIQFFQTDNIDEAVLPQLLDGIPAEVQLLQRLDHAHGAPGNRSVRDPVAA